MAVMCGGQLVEPPMAEFTTMAFSNAFLVRMRAGVKSSRTIPTMRRPVSYAILPRSPYGAGIAAQPGSDIPRASASEFIESAVPMVLQCPALSVDAQVLSINWPTLISPAASRRRASHSVMPDPDSLPSQ